MKEKRIICIVLACILLIGTVSVCLIAFAPEDPAPPVIRLSYTDAADIFEEAFGKFNTLIVDVNSAIAYYNEHNFTAIEDIKTYEAMWQNLSNDAKAIQTTLTENIPPKEYEDVWYAFADCMGLISAAFERDFDTNHDTEYTSIEIADLLREIGSEFGELADKACNLANELEAISATIKTDYFFLQIYNSEDQIVTKYKVTLAGIVSNTNSEITTVSFELVSGDVCETAYEIKGNAVSVMITHPTEGYLMRIFTLSTSGVFSAV